MLSPSRMGSSLWLLVLCAACGAQSSTPDTNTDVTAMQGVTPASAGISGGGSGARAVATGAAGVTSATAGRGGAVSVVAATAGASGGAAKAGSAGLAAAAGTGNRGDVVTEGGAGSAGTAGMSVATAGASGGGGSSSVASTCTVAPITEEMRKKYQHMDEAYYTKYASANGVIVGTGPKVADEAVLRYCQFLTEMVSNEKIRKAMIDDEMWFTMIDEDEQLSDLPQIDRMYGTSLNQRARGLGSLTPTICAEDSIMCLPGDRWRGDCICPHEAGHTLYSSGIARVSEYSDRLDKITSDIRSSGRLSNAYVWMDGNANGMIAWGIQAWYDCAIDGEMGGYHSDINTRSELQSELPELYQLLSEILPTDNKYEDCYANP
jgi:hypothetical protein